MKNLSSGFLKREVFRRLQPFFYICPYIFGGIAVETRLLYRNLAMSFAFSLSESAGSFYP